MRQAGRYLPEFRETRKGYPFFEFCKEPPLCTEVALQPLRRYPLDATIVFSDILTVPQALGLRAYMDDGPRFDKLVTSLSDLKPFDLASLNYVGKAVEALRVSAELPESTPVIGFAGAPLTLAGYMLEGGKSVDFAKARAFLLGPEGPQLLDLLVEALIPYCLMQIRAGAEVIQLFDTNAGRILNASEYQTLCVDPLDALSRALKQEYPEVLTSIFAKDQDPSIWAASSFDVVQLSSQDPILKTAFKLPSKVLQGNLDPQVLYESDETLVTRTQAMVREFQQAGNPYIANLGHGMEPTHDPRKLGLFLRTIEEV